MMDVIAHFVFWNRHWSVTEIYTYISEMLFQCQCYHDTLLNTALLLERPYNEVIMPNKLIDVPDGAFCQTILSTRSGLSDLYYKPWGTLLGFQTFL